MLFFFAFFFFFFFFKFVDVCADVYVSFYVCVWIDFANLTEKRFTYIIRESFRNVCRLLTKFGCPEVSMCGSQNSKTQLLN